MLGSRRVTLRARLLVVFGALAVLPLVVVAVIVGPWSADSLEAGSLDRQREVAHRVAGQIGGILDARADDGDVAPLARVAERDAAAARRPVARYGARGAYRR